MNETEYLHLAALEDRLWHFEALHAHVRRALQRVSVAPGGEILDAGCGTGGLLKRLARWFPETRLRGIDIAPLAVKLSRGRTSAVIDEGSVTELPYEDARFSAITSIDVLYHLERPQEALNEYARCLQPGGALIVNVPAYRWLWSYHDTAVNSNHRFNRRELIDLFRAAGLEPVYATYWNTLLFPAVVVRRKLLPAPKDGSGDVREYPAWVVMPIRGLLAVERAWLGAGARLPFGVSVFAVARKPGGRC